MTAMIVAASRAVAVLGMAVRFNFGSASPKAPLLFGVEAPGVPMKPGGAYNDPESVPVEIVNEWSDYLKEQNVKRTLCLLKPDEMGCYASPGYVELLQTQGIKPVVVNVFEEGACDKALAAYEEAVSAGEKIAVHCSGGEGRTGVVMGAILVKNTDITSAEAEAVIIAAAEAENVIRKPAAAKIDKLLKDGTLA
eukprot:scaffold143762_cov53-Attheya_sp.AAC.6